MTPKVAILTFARPWGPHLTSILRRVFGQALEIDVYCGQSNPVRSPVHADLILVAEAITYYAARQFFDPNTPVVYLTPTITKAQAQRIREIPAGTRVLVANDTDSSTAETITNFQMVGLTHLEYFPLTRSAVPADPLPRVAVTPGEPGYVPSYIRQVINIGQRVIDPQTVTEIAVYLGLEPLLSQEGFLSYVQEVCSFRNSLNYLLDRNTATSGAFLSLMDKLEEGMLLLDRAGLVRSSNRQAAQILGPQLQAGARIEKLLPCQLTREFSAIQTDTEVQILDLGGTLVSFRILPIQTGDLPSGALVELSAFEEKERQQRLLRRRIRQQGHTAKRTFADIVSVSPAMRELKETAGRHARSGATILITGESGTGKELLAQAIHNASDRREGPFVALNCAALPRELLESELFGYEEGAFTGARRGGKAGLFALAHTGTILLDEIGDMDLNLQARILRVLEEREVQRIGGDATLPVDIRVIAATNQNLWQLMEAGRFRRDLYYRLSVVPLEVPPLRQRPQDILPLFDHFARQKGRTFTLTLQAQRYLLGYPWYGNVRELRNWVEYLAALPAGNLDVRDLAPLSHSWTPQAAPQAAPQAQPAAPQPAAGSRQALIDRELEAFLGQIAGREAGYYLVLRELAAAPAGLGRHVLAQRLAARGDKLSELEIRRLTAQLATAGMLLPGAGRLGSRITPLGCAALERLAQDPVLGKLLGRLDN
ncbi:MAG TPA: sigma 54-interacting transcriptional regulator [Candidatus Anaerotruncus excrementipullorum]|uniref:Sigma 54-interacting transcriptional regulator n=1 Tax=Candidatus Anaerotruncus excrementipullorum TaxID=2838465 RepID=A0A9D1WT29_9FIRM|nr:sigma 54-interacting transcriptional regulator [Candidatus Anaerotruncus excrementipullorum]